ncbi:MAG: twin-arginine translocase TatA/TatE family subunit [Solirubrobacteraceae bacterium]
MGLDNPLHIAFLLVLLLLVFGARRLPEMGRSLGEGLRGFKSAVSGEHIAPAVATRAATPAPAQMPTPVAVQAATPLAVQDPSPTAEERSPR